MNDMLRTIIAEAYEVFPPRRFGALLHNVCTTCCVSAEQQALLIGTPRQYISAGLMQAYYSAAFGRCPDHEETEHFLPRLFELSAKGHELGTGGFERNFGHLGTRGADYRRSWEPGKVDLIDRYFLTLAQQSWQADLQDLTPGRLEIENVLCAIAQAGASLEPILSAWQADESRQATIQLACMISNLHWSRRRVGFAKLSNAFWDDISDQEQVCVAWLRNLEHRARFDAAMVHEEDDSTFAVLSLARDFVSGPI